MSVFMWNKFIFIILYFLIKYSIFIITLYIRDVFTYLLYYILCVYITDFIVKSRYYNWDERIKNVNISPICDEILDHCSCDIFTDWFNLGKCIKISSRKVLSGFIGEEIIARDRVAPLIIHRAEKAHRNFSRVSVRRSCRENASSSSSSSLTRGCRARVSNR